MPAKKKTEGLKKKTGGTAAPAKEKPAAKKKASAKKTAAKTSRTSRGVVVKKKVGKKPAAKIAGASRTVSARKKVNVKKTAAKKPLAKKTAARKPAAAKPPKKTAKTLRGKKTNRLEELKKNLIGRREAIVREAKEEIARYISGENRQLVDTALDDGDWAVVDISEDINLRRLGAHRKALHDIDESLRKLKEGTYGTCEECGEEIGEKRLQVLPTANLCITCQENKEQFEALEKEETS
jgi:DnaK suppressor protein